MLLLCRLLLSYQEFGVRSERTNCHLLALLQAHKTSLPSTRTNVKSTDRPCRVLPCSGPPHPFNQAHPPVDGASLWRRDRTHPGFGADLCWASVHSTRPQTGLVLVSSRSASVDNHVPAIYAAAQKLKTGFNMTLNPPSALGRQFFFPPSHLWMHS